MIIFLIGFMGSGKSTTGKELAKRLGYGFVDTDKKITEEFGMSVNEIFDRLGEEVFRSNETRVLESLASRKNIVVSTGGGLPCHSGNMDFINRNGISIYLKASPGALTDRLRSRKKKRPLIRELSDKELRKFIKKKLKEREPYYNMAQYKVKGLEVKIKDLINLVRD